MANLEETVEVDKLLRTGNKRRSSEQFLDLDITDTASASIELADGDGATFTITTEHDDDLRLFTTTHITVYESSVSAANKIQGGDNIGNTDYELSIWNDWGGTNNNNVVHKVWVVNNSGGTETILLRVNARFVVELASTGAAT